MAEWYYAVRGERMGPVAESEMADLVRGGTVKPDTLVWTQGMDDWAPAGSTLPQSLREPIDPTEPGLATTPASTASAGMAATGAPHAAFAGHEESTEHPTEFQEAVRTCFRKYATFSGRARRPEYWWFALFCFVVNIVLSLIDGVVFGANAFAPLSTLFGLAVLIPSLAVGARRLHDTGRTAWWLLIALVPLAGLIVLIVFFCQKGDEGANQYGPA